MRPKPEVHHAAAHPLFLPPLPFRHARALRGVGQRYMLRVSFLQDLKLLKSLSVVLPPHPDIPAFPEAQTEEERRADAEYQLRLEAWAP